MRNKPNVLEKDNHDFLVPVDLLMTYIITYKLRIYGNSTVQALENRYCHFWEHLTYFSIFVIFLKTTALYRYAIWKFSSIFSVRFFNLRQLITISAIFSYFSNDHFMWQCLWYTHNFSSLRPQLIKQNFTIFQWFSQ